jgi:hypothetical protein
VIEIDGFLNFHPQPEMAQEFKQNLVRPAAVPD